MRGAALTLTAVAGLTAAAAAVVPAVASSSSAPAASGIQIRGTVYNHPAVKGHPSLSIGSPQLDGVVDGPWTTAQGDPTEGTPYSPGLLLPSYTPGGATTTVGGVTEPNLAVYPGVNASSGTPPYASGTAGTPGPVPGYCSSGGPNPETGTVNREPTNEILPMSPYYFPDVVRNSDGSLTGYFDYRPKDTDEAIVVAKSLDGGHTWNFEGEALEQNQGYCPSTDTNDNGQGHPFVLTVKGKTLMYTLPRPAGDSLGVNLLVNKIHPNAANPLAGLPASQPTGTDPSTTASAAVSVPTTGGTGATISVSTLGTGPEQIGAPGAPLKFEDLSTSSPGASVITCAATSENALTGCTTAASGGLNISSGDTLIQALSTVTTATSIPQGPQNAAGTAGATVTITVPASTIASLFNANVPGRFYLDGATVYCLSVDSTNDTLSGCTTTQPGGVSVNVGDALTTDPIVPVSATQTTGLNAPDGIVGTLASYPGAPSNSTVIVYGEKILSYFDPTTTTNTTPIVLSASSGVTIPVGATQYPVYQFKLGQTISLQIGTGTKSAPGPVATVTCNRETLTSFENCTSANGAGEPIEPGAAVGGPGACTVGPQTLGQIGEGNTNPASLFKNNEDFTELRVAYTTNGVNFHNLGVLGGLHSPINDPSTTASPLTSGGGPANVAPGSTEPGELRFVGSRGTIIQNPNGSQTLFMSGAWCGDGDSDAFNQIFYSKSTDGVTWTRPVAVISTDYTFSARAAQDAALAGGQDDPLGISGYYAGRAYGPAVVQNSNGTLTMLFTGYSTPKPLPTEGAVLGTGATHWTIGTGDPALYRNILTVTLKAP